MASPLPRPHTDPPPTPASLCSRCHAMRMMGFARDVTGARRQAVLDERPARFRGKPPTSIHIRSTGGPGVRLDHRLW